MSLMPFEKCFKNSLQECNINVQIKYDFVSEKDQIIGDGALSTLIIVPFH